LLLISFGIVYLAYSSVTPEEDIQKTIVENQTEPTPAITANLAPNNLVDLQDKIVTLESKLEVLSLKLNQLMKAEQSINPRTLTPTNESDAISATPELKVLKALDKVMEDLKVQAPTFQTGTVKNTDIFRKHEVNLQEIMEDRALKMSQGASSFVKTITPNLAQTNTNQIEEPNDITGKFDPIVDNMKAPQAERLVANMNIATPTAPLAPKAPQVHEIKDSNDTPDVVWLKKQPQSNYTLLLASMPVEHSLNTIKSLKKLENTKILPQVRGDSTNYILVTGSFKNREGAEVLAKTIKAESGITPWIRKISDLTNKLK
jgi:septal ring-binding cell division protein DamX